MNLKDDNIHNSITELKNKLKYYEENKDEIEKKKKRRI
jgi:hypothetical protein